MSLSEMETLVRLALEVGLIGSERRRQLLGGLPMGFVYSLPTVSRPIDQLRFDLMELERTPRLIGLDRPPLAVWLSNAAEICATEGRTDAARRFADAAARVEGGRSAVEQVEALIKRIDSRHINRIGSVADGSVGIVHGSVTFNHIHAAPEDTRSADRSRRGAAGARDDDRPSGQSASPPGFPTDRRPLVLAVHPDAKSAWHTTDPPIDPQGRVYYAATPNGPWHRDSAPHSAPWRHAVQTVDDALETLRKAAQPGDCLAVFAKGPLSLGALIGARLRERLAIVSNVVVFQEVAFGTPPWHPWGPTWSRPVEPATEPKAAPGEATIPPRSTDIALVVQLSALIDDETVAHALTEAGAPAAPQIEVLPVDPETLPTFEDPAAVEGVHRDVLAAIERLEARQPRLRRLHLFFAGPLALMIRLGSTLHDRRFQTTVYEYRRDHRYVPAVRLGGYRPAALVARDDTRIPGAVGGYDVFLASARADDSYANRLYDALTDQRLRTFFADRSVQPGDIWATAIPAALARSRLTLVLVSPQIDEAWYVHSEIWQAIGQFRKRAQDHRVVPVLIGGAQPTDLPLALRPLKALSAPSDDIGVIAASVRELLTGEKTTPLRPGMRLLQGGAE